MELEKKGGSLSLKPPCTAPWAWRSKIWLIYEQHFFIDCGQRCCVLRFDVAVEGAKQRAVREGYGRIDDVRYVYEASTPIVVSIGRKIYNKVKWTVFIYNKIYNIFIVCYCFIVFWAWFLIAFVICCFMFEAVVWCRDSQRLGCRDQTHICEKRFK